MAMRSWFNQWSCMLTHIIKKGKCDYRHILAHAVTAGPEHDTNEQHDMGFNSLSAVIDADIPDETENIRENEHDIQENNAKDILDSELSQSETILSEARKEAADIMAQAREAMRDAQRRGEEIESQAYSQGFDQGRKDGEEIGRRQYHTVVQRLEKLLDSIKSGTEALLPQYEAQMVKVIMTAARHIVEREIKLSPDIVLESIRAAMAQVVEGSVAHLHLNPFDIDALESEIKEKFAQQGSTGLNIVSDPGIDRGGCLIETEYGLIDATTRAKWQAVSDTINGILMKRTGAVPAGDKTILKDDSASLDTDSLHEIFHTDRQEQSEKTV